MEMIKLFPYMDFASQVNFHHVQDLLILVFVVKHTISHMDQNLKSVNHKALGRKNCYERVH